LDGGLSKYDTPTIIAWCGAISWSVLGHFAFRCAQLLLLVLVVLMLVD
jgi:hypothetical protein